MTGSDSTPDVNRLIAEVQQKDNVRILPGDPAFALVTINQLTLEELANRLNEGLRSGIAEFIETVGKTESRAGTVLAQQVKGVAAAFRLELQGDIDAARVNASEMMRRLDHILQKKILLCCGVVLVSAFLAFFAAGVWVGAALKLK